MAEDTESNTPRTTQREAQEALEKQVAQLKREIGKINRALAERAEEVVEEAGGWYDSAADRASRATQALRSQAQTVSATVRDNPGTVSSALVLGGLVGMLIGLALGQASGGSHNHRRWY